MFITLPKAKNSWENFRGKLKNCKSLAQRICPRLRYIVQAASLCMRVFDYLYTSGIMYICDILAHVYKS